MTLWDEDEWRRMYDDGSGSAITPKLRAEIRAIREGEHPCCLNCDERLDQHSDERGRQCYADWLARQPLDPVE